MTDATTVTTPFTMVGDATAAACEGDFCAVPDHHEQAVVNALLDSDNI
jgi:hypothetical protein